MKGGREKEQNGEMGRDSGIKWQNISFHNRNQPHIHVSTHPLFAAGYISSVHSAD